MLSDKAKGASRSSEPGTPSNEAGGEGGEEERRGRARRTAGGKEAAARLGYQGASASSCQIHASCSRGKHRTAE
eukprot:4135655-Prorocentrum_lima.AAC.1